MPAERSAVASFAEVIAVFKMSTCFFAKALKPSKIAFEVPAYASKFFFEALMAFSLDPAAVGNSTAEKNRIRVGYRIGQGFESADRSWKLRKQRRHRNVREPRE